MSFAQISTSTLTVISSVVGKGFQAISLTDYTTSALSTIAAGSAVEISGAFFLADSAVTPNASSFTAITTATTCYLDLTVSGTSGSQLISASWSSVSPTWRTDFNGWYLSSGSNIRVVASAYKTSATQQNNKILLHSLIESTWDSALQTKLGLGWPTQMASNYVWRGEIERLTSGSGNYTVPANVYRLRVTCIGGGGGGGVGATSASGGGGGGGGGGTNISLVIGNVISVTPGQSIAYSVGGGGAAGSGGTQTTFAGATTGAGGGAGGNASGITGGAGGLAASSNAGAAGNPGGGGGGSAGSSGGSGGGAGGRGDNGGANVTAGNYGGGGGGGFGGTASSGNGAAGGSGIIIIEY